MPYVNVHVDASDVLEELEDTDLQKELDRRARKHAPSGSSEIYTAQLLEQVWLHFRGKDAPACLREYIWRTLGKCL